MRERRSEAAARARRARALSATLKKWKVGIAETKDESCAARRCQRAIRARFRARRRALGGPRGPPGSGRPSRTARRGARRRGSRARAESRDTACTWAAQGARVSRRNPRTRAFGEGGEREASRVGRSQTATRENRTNARGPRETHQFAVKSTTTNPGASSTVRSISSRSFGQERVCSIASATPSASATTLLMYEQESTDSFLAQVRGRKESEPVPIIKRQSCRFRSRIPEHSKEFWPET